MYLFLLKNPIQLLRLVAKKVKNVKNDAITGDRIGRVHVDHQDLNDMQARRVKALRTTEKELKAKQTLLS